MRPLHDRSARAGSSPRARGTVARRPRRQRRRRFIPACAGNRSPSLSACSACAVHPRVRGEQLVVVNTPFQRLRFIPACAGNRTNRRCDPGASTVHPRVRGEQSVFGGQLARLSGSSPRARGTGQCACRRRPTRRFIPACAGNSRRRRFWVSASAVHPRVRGEQICCEVTPTSENGSSPRARGTGFHTTRLWRFDRFIPACAGNRIRFRCWLSLLTVHPRVRGEQPLAPRSAARSCGSSPRARGTDPPGRISSPKFRFIPACAGNSSGHRTRPTRRPVHPRVRGEQPFTVGVDPASTGSSPRARGTGKSPGKPARGSPVHPRVRGEQTSRAPGAGSFPGSSPRARGTGV